MGSQECLGGSWERGQGFTYANLANEIVSFPASVEK